MGLYELVNPPVGYIAADGDAMLHTESGGVLDLDDETAGELGDALRRLDAAESTDLAPEAVEDKPPRQRGKTRRREEYGPDDTPADASDGDGVDGE